MQICPQEDVLLRFLSGLLPRRHRALLEMHFDACQRCLELLVAAERSCAWTSAAGATATGAPFRASFDDEQGIDGYDLIRQLGRGGMGVVYDARNRKTGERVALKTVCPTTPGAKEALRREVRALAHLDHPGVVRVRTEGTCRGVPFYTMDVLAGPSLARVLAEETERGPNKRILTLLRRIASTLAHLHAAGVVHRDLTPSNVLLRLRDQPVLVDFGLAAHFPAALGRDVLGLGTRTVGTLAYMAPEQIRGQIVDARADLYAFGCILYEALTGRVPFTAHQRDAVLRQHLEKAPCPPSLLVPRIPAVLERLTLRLLAKAPADRIEYAADVAAALGSLGAADWDEGPIRPPHTAGSPGHRCPADT